MYVPMQALIRTRTRTLTHVHAAQMHTQSMRRLLELVMNQVVPGDKSNVCGKALELLALLLDHKECRGHVLEMGHSATLRAVCEFSHISSEGASGHGAFATGESAGGHVACETACCTPDSDVTPLLPSKRSCMYYEQAHCPLPEKGQCVIWRVPICIQVLRCNVYPRLVNLLRSRCRYRLPAASFGGSWLLPRPVASARRLRRTVWLQCSSCFNLRQCPKGRKLSSSVMESLTSCVGSTRRQNMMELCRLSLSNHVRSLQQCCMMLHQPCRMGRLALVLRPHHLSVVLGQATSGEARVLCRHRDSEK